MFCPRKLGSEECSFQNKIRNNIQSKEYFVQEMLDVFFLAVTRSSRGTDVTLSHYNIHTVHNTVHTALCNMKSVMCTVQ